MFQVFLSTAILILISLFVNAPTALAATFSPMVGIPGIDPNQNYTMIELINRIYIFLIAAGAVIGVVKIALAGVKYATTDIGGNKSQAKEDIKNVLLGLLILMSPYIVLTIINPNFVNLNVLQLGSLSLPQDQNSQKTGSDVVSNGNEYTIQCPGTCPANAASNNCKKFINDCHQVSGTAVPISFNSAGFQTYGCKVKAGGSCPNTSIGDSASEKTCGSCQAALCLSFEKACEKAGGTVRPLPGDEYRSTCVVTSNTCPDLP